MSSKPIQAPRLTWQRKVLFSSITLAIFFFLLEGFLALCGVPQLRSAVEFWESPFPGETLFVQKGAKFLTRPEKLTYFNEQTFSVDKAPNTYRIFCLGESTTYGHPYADSKSYVGVLRQLLNRSASDTNWEVVNCGGISYASYRLAGMMQELAAYKPDLFIVYVGQNEFLEERTFREVRSQSTAKRVSQEFVGLTRTGTIFRRILRPEREEDLMLNIEVDTILDHSEGLADYHRDDTLKSAVVQQYRESLATLCARARGCGAEILFVEPASNLRFSPFKSELSDADSSPSEQIDSLISNSSQLITDGKVAAAIADLEQLVTNEPLYAAAHFWRGEAQYQQESYSQAIESFQRAIDEDVCPLRAISGLHTALREVAKEESVPLIDFPKMISEYSLEHGGNGVAGPESFLDHVHPQSELHLQLAYEIARVLHAGNPSRFPDPELTTQNMAEVRAASIGISSPAVEAMALCNLAQTLTWAGKVKESLPLAEQASALDPTNVWIMSQYARLLDKSGKHVESRKTYERALKIDRRDPMSNYRLGMMCLEDGDPVTALPLLETAHQNMPAGAPLAIQSGLQQALSETYRQLGRPMR